jgi:sialidase-1
LRCPTVARKRAPHVIFSDDGGAAWQISGSTDGWCDESTVLERADGSLYLNIRNGHSTHRRAYAVSSDEGTTWSPPA